MNRLSFALPLAAATALVTGTLVLAPVAPAFAEAQVSCVTDPNGSDSTTDDLCTVEAGNWTVLNADPTNVLANDGDGLAVTGVEYLGYNMPGDPTDPDPTKPAIGFMGGGFGTDGTNSYTDFGIGVNFDVVDTFYAVYITSDGAHHMITFNVIPYVPPVVTDPLTPAKVTKASKPGYLKVCAPKVNKTDLLFIYGSYKDPFGLYDGHTVVTNGTCKLVRVHRHAIDWEAYGTQDGSSAGYDHIKGIKLPKGDHLP